jgi:rhodanese-related sulfurtransferase
MIDKQEEPFMKKAILLLLTVALMASLWTGCASQSPAPSKQPAPASSSAAPTSSPAAESQAPAESQPAAEEADVVYQLAYQYFENFPSDRNVISSADLFALMDAEEDMFILDIRRPDDYNTSHLKGAVNLSFFTTDISDNLDKIPDDKPVMVYCYTGQTASQVTALLNVAGKMAKNVQSGFNNGISAAEGYEKYLETDANPLPDESYPVDPAVQKALSDYFVEKQAQDGTAFVNFNLKPEDVKQIIDDQNDDYYILSIRSAEDYAKGHIPTASHIAYGLGMQEELVKLPKDKKIVVYCYSGQTSSQTTAILRLLGYDAYSMSGGMGNAEKGTGWLGAGFETVTD